MANMWFKVGTVRWTKEKGWSHEYSVHLLPEDSMLSELGFDEDMTEMFGLREDQPDYDQVHDFKSLQDVIVLERELEREAYASNAFEDFGEYDD